MRITLLPLPVLVLSCGMFGVGCSGSGVATSPQQPSAGNNAVGGSGAGGNLGGASPGTGGVSVASNTESGGGTSSVGGTTTTGGKSSAGGTISSGGTRAGGGSPSTGGSVATGGNAGGGSPSTGGSVATGGTKAGGGSPSTGGSVGTGGTKAGGGAATGGVATGGVAAGGKSASGGAATGGLSFGAGGGCSTGIGAVATTVTFKPGGTWNDTTGTPIQAHGGGFLKVCDTWYWVGEDKTTNTGGSGFFYAVSLYASKDLVTWEHRNKIITTATDPQLAGSNLVIERPKIIYNDKTNMYVMWAHWDNTSYNDGYAGIFKSPTIDGNYTYVDHIKPGGNLSKDCTLFKDDDGKAYFISVSVNNSDIWVYPLSDDYLSVQSGSKGTDILPGQYREAPAIVKVNGTYYLITSWSSGWNSTQGEYTTATSITGPWSAQQNIGDSTTYNSQSTYIITVAGSQSTTYIFAGDRWNSGNLSKSQYVWLPLTINGKTMSMSNYSQWSLNLGTGVWSAN